MNYSGKLICMMMLLFVLLTSAVYSAEITTEGVILTHEEFKYVLWMQDDHAQVMEMNEVYKNKLLDVGTAMDKLTIENDRMKRNRRLLIGGLIVESVALIAVIIFK